ncbi:MAG: phage distal tail protein, partial [bacterium]
SASGSLTYGPDTLEIDTYNRVVFLNGEYYGARTKLEVYNDWVTLSPGANVISFYDNGAASNSSAKITVQYRSGWLG